jgi:hypothetical protein
MTWISSTAEAAIVLNVTERWQPTRKDKLRMNRSN